ncbi:MAG: hypothetical protein EAZ92_05255 [Candidatus Kapaibacterium sp.]|nr:MAG: hypothetical protein EAZ92_05255 [Candidatus Kapabacteria bacterium]
MSSSKKPSPKKSSPKKSASKKSASKKTSSTEFPPKKASHQTSAPPPLPPGASAPFRILIVESHRIYARGLHMDIRKEEIAHTDVQRVQSFEEAETVMAEHPPQVVILGLQLPENGTERFFEQYPAHSRRFALILFDSHVEENDAHQNSLRHQMNAMHLLAEQHACSYLRVGIFHNDDLVASLERARREVQTLLLKEQEQRIMMSLEEYLHHPFVLAVSKYAQNLPAKTRTLSAQAREGVLRFFVSKEQYVIEFDRILRVQGEGKYCYLFYFNAQGTLESKHVEKKWITNTLPESLVRVHTSHWVNIAYICSIEETEITLLNSDTVPLSRAGRETLSNIFSHLSPQLYGILLLQNALDTPSGKIFGVQKNTPQNTQKVFRAVSRGNKAHQHLILA